MNLTDIDDKTIKGALQNNVPLERYTMRYKQAFFEDLKRLKILPAHCYPEATAYIPDMIAMIETLLAKKMAYRDGQGNVYFAIRSFPSYGALSALSPDALRAGGSNRVHSDEYDKESVADFVLWKAHDTRRDGEIFWESPFGPGRPGWHIECSTMAMKLLDETVDIHMGGVDNIFPHHENEIAQSEGCTGKPFSRYWMHTEHLIVEGKKMSKSLGNFFTLRDLLARGYTGSEIRYLLAGVHYRMPLNFTLTGLEAARAALRRLRDFVDRLRKIADSKAVVTGVHEKSARHVAHVRDRFRNALSDDLNISAALGFLFDWVRMVNKEADAVRLTAQAAKEALLFFDEVDAIVCILPFEEEREDPVPVDVAEALHKREEARGRKDWDEADRQRDYIRSRGFVPEDTPMGPRIKRALHSDDGRG